jgi:hypothetical protein
MPKKLPPEQRAIHIGVRFRPEDRARIERVARKLHKRGVGGMINLEGEPIATNVIRYLLKQADEEDEGEKE